MDKNISVPFRSLEAKLINQEQDRTTCWLKEVISIRNRGKNSTQKDKDGLTNSMINSFWNGNPDEMISLQQPTKGLPCLSAEQSEQGSLEELKYFYLWVPHKLDLISEIIYILCYWMIMMNVFTAPLNKLTICDPTWANEALWGRYQNWHLNSNSMYCSISKEHFATKMIFISYSYQTL